MARRTMYFRAISKGGKISSELKGERRNIDQLSWQTQVCYWGNTSKSQEEKEEGGQGPTEC